MRMARQIYVLVDVIVACGLASAQNCDSQQSIVDDLQKNIERDKGAIKSLGFNTDSAEFDALAKASEEQRSQMVRTAFENLLGALTGAVGEWATEALKPEAQLPNGFASLNPFNVNTYIKGLEDPNGPVVWLLRQIAATSDKAAKLKFLKGLPDAVDLEKGSYDLLFGKASSKPESLAAYLQLTTALAQLFGFSQTAAVLEIGTSSAEVLVAYASLFQGNFDALNQLNHLSIVNANALATYDSTMRTHIQALQGAKSKLDTCTQGQGPGPYSISYSRNGPSMSIAVGFEGAAPPDNVDAWLKGPGGLIKSMAVCSQRSPAWRNGRKVASLFYTGCNSLVSSGHWEVNVCPTAKTDAAFQCSQTWVNGELVFSHCGCGITEERLPKYEPEFSIPVDLAPGESVWVKIKSQ